MYNKIFSTSKNSPKDFPKESWFELVRKEEINLLRSWIRTTREGGWSSYLIGPLEKRIKELESLPQQIQEAPDVVKALSQGQSNSSIATALLIYSQISFLGKFNVMARTGGWSTHLIKPMQERIKSLREALSDILDLLTEFPTDTIINQNLNSLPKLEINTFKITLPQFVIPTLPRIDVKNLLKKPVGFWPAERFLKPSPRMDDKKFLLKNPLPYEKYFIDWPMEKHRDR